MDSGALFGSKVGRMEGGRSARCGRNIGNKHRSKDMKDGVIRADCSALRKVPDLRGRDLEWKDE